MLETSRTGVGEEEVLSLNLKESGNGFCRRGRRRSLQVEGWKDVPGAGTDRGKSYLGNLKAKSNNTTEAPKTQHSLFCTMHILTLKKTDSFVWSLLLDFSSSFNTIQPQLMAWKLLKLDVNPRLILWIADVLVNRPQTVRHQAALSSSCSISIGSPQGTVLFPIPFTLYTNDCTGTDTTPVIKYSDDSAIEDLSKSVSVYFAEVKRFSNWCRDNWL